MFRLILSILISLLALSACKLTKSTSIPFLIVMVENLGVEQVNCSATGAIEENFGHSGISAMCAESVRFTHAFTPSVMASPAVASILTGTYPIEHGLRHNGQSFLSSKKETWVERAHQQGYKTAFFSGGPPLLRKHNLHQGFDLFEDQLNLNPDQLFRKFEDSIQAFHNWRTEFRNDQWISFFYIPDLLFPQTPTTNYLGKSRDLTSESQIAEFDETLFELIQKMKSEKIWDKANVILVGLNGPATYTRPGELDHTSLFSDRTHVALLFKPSQKQRDQGLSWSIDENVTLADLGKTLSEFFDSNKTQTHSLYPDFPVFSFKKSLSQLNQKIPNRPILLETAWPQWQEKTSVRYATRMDQFLFIYDQPMQVFNSLIDRFELYPIKLTETSIADSLAEAHRLGKANKLPLWPGLSREAELKWQNLSQRLAYRLKEDQVISNRYSQELMKSKNWSELLKWAEGMKKLDYQTIAKINLSEKSAVPKLQSELIHPCLKKDIQNCTDTLASLLLYWQQSQDNENLKKRFQREFQQAKSDASLSEINWKFQGIWDISQTTDKKLELTYLLLALPEMEKFR